MTSNLSKKQELKIIDLSNKPRKELISILKEKGIKGCSKKKKAELISLIKEQPINSEEVNTTKNGGNFEEESINSEEEKVEVILNRGTGAGGANTTKNGGNFEEKTNNQKRLLQNGWRKEKFPNSKKDFDYLSKREGDTKIICAKKHAFKKYMKNNHNTNLFREPDESYIKECKNSKIKVKILEKKNQNMEGSVDIKILAGPCFKKEYQYVLGENVEVSYAFCLSSWYKKKFMSGEKKYTILKQILEEDNIVVLFGDDEDYFEKLDKWINS